MRCVNAVGLVVLGLTGGPMSDAQSAAAQASFEPEGTPPKEVRLILRDSSPVNLVQPWLSNGMFYGWLRIGPYKIVGVDSIPAARVLCFAIPDNRLTGRNLLSFAATAGLTLAAIGAAMPDEPGWLKLTWDLDPEDLIESVFDLANSASGSPRSCTPPP